MRYEFELVEVYVSKVSTVADNIEDALDRLETMYEMPELPGRSGSHSFVSKGADNNVQS